MPPEVCLLRLQRKENGLPKATGVKQSTKFEAQNRGIRKRVFIRICITAMGSVTPQTTRDESSFTLPPVSHSAPRRPGSPRPWLGDWPCGTSRLV
ncbi:hypothetical protein NPIL_267651 [Nephila pilipes]|uniref:Uncharacterized protein n=1 Tax=Nephila pilipes TaxID=299642 RepID=A0A8X6T001_NEPPI|nr:hypothetical protein NPIL_267651 [Nephila pilipes]